MSDLKDNLDLNLPSKPESKPPEHRKTGRPTEWTDEKLSVIGNEMLEYFKENEDKYLFLDWVITTEYTKRQVQHWRETNTVFADLHARTKSILEVRILKLMLASRNPNGAIFLLKNHYDYTDKQEMTHKGGITLAPMSREEVQKRIDELRDRDSRAPESGETWE